MLISNNPKVIIKPILILSAFVFYDTLWDWSLSLLHHIFGILHLMFEFCEHTLERLIEHLFHADPRTAEIAVFYILLTIGVYAAFKVIRVLPHWYNVFAAQIAGYWQQEKASALEHWQAQPIRGKIQWGAIFTVLILVMGLWLGS